MFDFICRGGVETIIYLVCSALSLTTRFTSSFSPIFDTGLAVVSVLPCNSSVSIEE